MLPQRQYSSSFHAPVESDAPAYHFDENAASECCFPPSEHPSGPQAPFSSPDDTIYYDPSFKQLYSSDMPTASGPSEFYVNHPTTSNVFVHGSGVQSTANPYDVPLEPSYLDAGFIAPAQPIPFMNSFQATGSNTSGHPALGQGFMEQYNNGVSAAGASVSAPSSANFAVSPSEVSQLHTFPAQAANSAASVIPQETSQSSGDLRPCQWRNDQGEICGERLGWSCESHLASVHGIRKLPAYKVIICGACDEGKKRKFFVRHFREVHLGFHRRKRNVT
ncbi:hypothetical protein EDD15DRAFT_342609 [Pisolithus albus]|nr:hypothetical protein EDD15DRAFT_342609 [Pisolithus albus]